MMNPEVPDLKIPADLPVDATLSYIGDESKRVQTPAQSATLSIARWSVSVGATAAPHVDAEIAGSPAGTPTAPSNSLVLKELIAKGGMGEVWEAFQPSLERVIAIKRMKNLEKAKTPEARARIDAEFRREAIMAGQLEHPNIVPVHDLGADDAGDLLLAMKLVHGKPWDAVIDEDMKALSTADFLAKHIPILIDMAQAVAFAHSRGIVHRDLKPAQVMIGEFGEVQLMDWGLAISVLDEVAPARESPLMTALPTKATGSSPSGTPALMAPEQTRMSAADVGPWTDIYLLGGTLYYLLTGSFPHRADSVIATFMKAAQGNVETPSSRATGRDVPEELELLCMSCLKFDTGERLESAKQFAVGLQDYLTGAGRRRESVALTAEVAGDVDRAKGSYSVLSDCLTRLSRAAELWSDNPAVQELRQRTHELYGKAAVAAGDLRLARVEAESLAAGTTKDGLLAAVAEGEAAALAQARTKRFALAACAVLAIAMIFGSVVYARNVGKARDQERAARTEAEQSRDVAKSALAETRLARDAAQQARGRAEGLLDFMMKDLSAGLEPLGKLDLLSAVSTQATEYFADMPLDGTPKEIRQRASAMAQLATVIIKEGRAPEAFPVIDKVDETLSRLSGPEAITKETLALRMNSALVRATASRYSGAIADAKAQTLGALSIYDNAPKSAREGVVLQGMAAEAMTGLYETMLMTGDADAATSATLSGLKLRESIAVTKPDDLMNRVSLARFKIGSGDISAIFRADVAGAIPSYADALEEIRDARKSDPTDYNAIQIESQVLGRLSYMYSLLPNEGAKALQYGLEGLAIDEAQAIRNPTNVDAQRNLAISHSLLSISLEKSNRCDEAIEQARKSVEVQLRVTALDPTGVAALSSLASRYEFLADVLQRTGKSEESLVAFQSLREIVRKLPRNEVEGLASDLGTATVWAGFANSLQNYSLNLYRMEKPEDALQVLDEADEISNLAAVGKLDSDKWILSKASIAVRRAQILLELNRAAEALELLDNNSPELERLSQMIDQGVAIEGLAPDQVLGTALDIRSLRVLLALVRGKALLATGDAKDAHEALESVASRRVEYEAVLASGDVESTEGSCNPESGQKRKGHVVAGMHAEACLLLDQPEVVRELEASGILRKGLRSFTLRDAAKKAGYVFEDEKVAEDAGK